MLEFIHIQRFKTLLDASFPCAQLCLFSGLNGMGKSSLIQTLLLLRQSYEKNTLFSKGLLLKGDYITLGTGQDVLSADADENTFSFSLRWKDSPLLSFKFEFVQNSDLQPIISSVEMDVLDRINLFNKNFQYLSAERVSSHSIFDTSDYNIEELNSIGNHGEYAAYYIAENASRNIPIPALKHKQSDSLSFSENLNCWMSEISPGVRISADVQRKTNTASLSYSFIQG
ncbi:MAG: hypothetical protein LBR47_04815, partial [Spirochaetaceae bacterium]|nr:hypothetical protein [Spirochaetaceae bacterium]